MNYPTLKDREIIFEIARAGTMLRVTAVDVATMTEIHLPMPATASEAMCRQAGLQRLTFVLKKRGIIA
ncbi:MAG: hypothetical protein V4621_06490 [Pseudomonadota bacterium]